MTTSMRRVLVLTAVLTAVFTLSAWAVGELGGTTWPGRWH
jgi:hypothetical protein